MYFVDMYLLLKEYSFVELGLVGIEEFRPAVVKVMIEDQEKGNTDYGLVDPHRE